MSANNDHSLKTQNIDLRNEVSELKIANSEFKKIVAKLMKRNEANIIGFLKDFKLATLKIKALTIELNAIGGSVDL